MNSEVLEVKKTSHTTHYDLWVLAADVWDIVELTVPPTILDAGNPIKAEAVNPQEAETLEVTSEISGTISEEVKGHLKAEGTSAEKKQEFRSTEARPGCEQHFTHYIFPHWQHLSFIYLLGTPLGCLN